MSIRGKGHGNLDISALRTTEKAEADVAGGAHQRNSVPNGQPQNGGAIDRVDHIVDLDARIGSCSTGSNIKNVDLALVVAHDLDPQPLLRLLPSKELHLSTIKGLGVQGFRGSGLTPRRSTGHACPNANMASAQLVSTIGMFSHVAGCRSVGKSSRDEGGRGVCLRDLRLLLLPHHYGLPAELADGERDVSPRYAKDGVDEIARLRCAKAFWSAIKSPAYPIAPAWWESSPCNAQNPMQRISTVLSQG